MDYAKHCQARWGSYVKAHDDPDVTNDMRSRTLPCIVLGPTGNIQGSIKCYNLEMKVVVKRRNITPLPMPDRVIKRVVALGQRAKQTRTKRNLQFLDRSGQEFDWTVDENEGLVEPSPSETDGLPAEIPGVVLESDLVDDTSPIQSPPAISDADLATAALANANLATPDPDAEIAGVDSTPPIPIAVSDDEDSTANEEQEQDDQSKVEFIGENLGHEEDEQEVVEVDDGDEPPEVPPQGPAPGDESEGEEDEADSTHATRRRSRRKRVKRTGMVIDFYNYAYAVQDRVMHINPNVLEQVREDAKITSETLFLGEKSTSGALQPQALPNKR
jgi:hypothetical protein